MISFTAAYVDFFLKKYSILNVNYSQLDIWEANFPLKCAAFYIIFFNAQLLVALLLDSIAD